MNRFAIGEGIAGFVSDTGKSVNMADICCDEGLILLLMKKYKSTE